MISVWRLDKEEHIKETIEGEGARLFGGRWNVRGSRLIYTSESLALATLEKFAHISTYDLKIELKSLEIKIPKAVSIQTLNLSDLNKFMKSTSTQEIGTSWIREEKTAVLKVPSAIIQSENNYLINPLHSDFKKIEIKDPIDFKFDDRLWK